MKANVIVKGAPSAKFVVNDDTSAEFIVNGNTGAEYNVNGMGGVRGPKGEKGDTVILAPLDLKAFLASVGLLGQKVILVIPDRRALLAKPGQTVKMAPKALLARTPQLPAQQPA